METWSVVTVTASTCSLFCTFFAIIVCLTQKSWKKRDGVLLLNIFIVDVLFSCTSLSMHVCAAITRKQTLTGVVLSHMFVFVLLMSWFTQCLVTINRYIVITFPFDYKTFLKKSRLRTLTGLLWTIVIVFFILSIIFRKTKPVHNRTVTGFHQFFLSKFSWYGVCILVALHGIALFIINMLEFSLWKTARAHEKRYRSITFFVKSNELQPNKKSQRKTSFTKSLQRRLSFTQHGVTVRRTPFFLLGAHIISSFAYMTVLIFYLLEVRNKFEYKYMRTICISTLILLSLRPIINVFNHVSRRNMKKFNRLLQKLLNNTSSELCTEYYIENHKEVASFKLRRESTHSMVTESSVV